VVDGVQTKLRLIPSGILRDRTRCLIGAGVVVDGLQLLKEMKDLRGAGIDITPERLTIDQNAELVLDYHRAIDQAREAFRGNNKIGTTGRGIGPAYEDRAARTGVRLCELRALDRLAARVRANVEEKNRYLAHVLMSETQVSFDEVWRGVQEAAEGLIPFIGNVSALLGEAFSRERRVVFEGAQGTLLDGVFGSYPFVTSSSTIAGGVTTGCGFGPREIDYVLGVAKAYCTRVGEGPFPTEETGELGEHMRTKGGEFGVNTGRPRRCGWFDGVAMRYAVRLSGIDSLAITKLDVLGGFEKVKFCYRYRLDGKKLDDVPPLASDFERVEPEYVELDGWPDDIRHATKWHQLPATARLYLDTLAEAVGCPVSIASVGAERESTIFSSNAAYLKNFVR
jgi:adenylosuccinate synthase